MNQVTVSLIAGILLLMLLACGCSNLLPPPRSPPAEWATEHEVWPVGPHGLEGVTWHLVAFHTASGHSVQILPGTGITLYFGGNGKISGLAGCNHFTAGYAVTGYALTVSTTTLPVQQCESPSGVMSQEAMFFAFLTRVSGYTTEGDHLVLKDASGTPILTFSAVMP